MQETKIKYRSKFSSISYIKYFSAALCGSNDKATRHSCLAKNTFKPEFGR